ncbi:MAG TPA: hypothetical protein VFB72_11340, partial [Verrucomicrobiae bacterium]|nr:hypothetical protein [Verrucomicrobiae bacterium]
ALALNPNHIEALNNLAWILAANENPEFRNGGEAVRLATRACAETGNNHPVLLGTLAAAYAETGDFTNAIAAASRAHDLALAGNRKKVAELDENMLKLFRAGHPYHEESRAL